MSNTMTAHEPIHYLDSILNEEEKRCEYSHQWRNFTISRSGRFRSKNKKRDVVDGKLFDAGNGNAKENEKISARNMPSNMSKSYQISANNSNTNTTTTSSSMSGTTTRSQRDKTESYKSFYETNL